MTLKLFRRGYRKASHLRRQAGGVGGSVQEQTLGILVVLSWLR